MYVHYNIIITYTIRVLYSVFNNKYTVLNIKYNICNIKYLNLDYSCIQT